MELVMILDLIVGTTNILLFSACVWMGYQKAKDEDKGR